jgi:hypothetical protein
MQQDNNPSSSTKYWCQLPFTSIQTNGVNASPCCNFLSNGPILLNNYHQNHEIIEVRQKILNNEVPDQCRKCVNDEQVTGQSFRTINNQSSDLEDLDYYITQDDKINHLFLIGRDVCNLKCLPCYDSSFIRKKELHQLHIKQTIPLPEKKVDYNNLLNLNFNKITITGGEPFYDKSILSFLDMLKLSGRSNDIELDITTNLTLIKKRTLEFLIKNFKKLQIKGSIDGLGVANDYLRYPSDWQNIEHSVDLILSMPEIEFCITTALSNLSLLKFHELVAWGIEKNIRNHYISTVYQPLILSVQRLPLNIKKSLLPVYENLKNSVDNTYYDRTAVTIDRCISVCQDTTDYNMKKLIQYLKKHDNLRNTNFLLPFPELREYE